VNHLSRLIPYSKVSLCTHLFAVAVPVSGMFEMLSLLMGTAYVRNSQIICKLLLKSRKSSRCQKLRIRFTLISVSDIGLSHKHSGHKNHFVKAGDSKFSSNQANSW